MPGAPVPPTCMGEPAHTGRRLTHQRDLHRAYALCRSAPRASTGGLHSTFVLCRPPEGDEPGRPGIAWRPRRQPAWAECSVRRGGRLTPCWGVITPPARLDLRPSAPGADQDRVVFGTWCTVNTGRAFTVRSGRSGRAHNAALSQLVDEARNRRLDPYQRVRFDHRGVQSPYGQLVIEQGGFDARVTHERLA